MQKTSKLSSILLIPLLMAGGCASRFGETTEDIADLDPMITQAIEIEKESKVRRADVAKLSPAPTANSDSEQKASNETEATAKAILGKPSETIRQVSGVGEFNPPPSVLQKVRRDTLPGAPAPPVAQTQPPQLAPQQTPPLQPTFVQPAPAYPPAPQATSAPQYPAPTYPTPPPPVAVQQPYPSYPQPTPTPALAAQPQYAPQYPPQTQNTAPTYQQPPAYPPQTQHPQAYPQQLPPQAQAVAPQYPQQQQPAYRPAPQQHYAPPNPNYQTQQAQLPPQQVMAPQGTAAPYSGPQYSVAPQQMPAYPAGSAPPMYAPAAQPAPAYIPWQNTQPVVPTNAPPAHSIAQPSTNTVAVASVPDFPNTPAPQPRVAALPAPVAKSMQIQQPLVTEATEPIPVPRKSLQDPIATNSSNRRRVPAKLPSTQDGIEALPIPPRDTEDRKRSFAKRKVAEPVEDDPDSVMFWDQVVTSPIARNERLAEEKKEMYGELEEVTTKQLPLRDVSKTTTPPKKTRQKSSLEEPVGFRRLIKEQQLNQTCQIDLGIGAIKTVIDPYGMRYLRPYVGLGSEFDNKPIEVLHTSSDALDAWWHESVSSRLRPESNTVELTIESLMVRALANSKFVKAISDSPLIRERAVVEAKSEFDTTRFLETRFRRPSEPVGNELTTGPGGSNRFRENDFTFSGGISRKTRIGGRVQLAQQVGLLNNNSQFINPKHQGNARLTLNLSQPLMRGSGRAYNNSLIMLAQIDHRMSWDDVSTQLQDYLVDVTETYWQLYLERARLHQKERHLKRGREILAELEQRSAVDAVANQIARARAAVSSRESAYIRAKTNVRNMESTLRGLVNDPTMYGEDVEMIPAELPRCDWLNINVRDAMAQALKGRSEIDQAIQQIRAAGVRLSVAQNELMPVLDMYLETYLLGIRGENDIGQAWVDSFSVGEPSYSVGLRYEIPINNRAAKNRHERRRLEMRQAIRQFQFGVEELMSEVEIAVREVEASHQEMLARHQAMQANETDLNYFKQRWRLLPGDDRSASFLLEDILEAHDRLAAEESNFAQTQVNYAMSLVNLKRALGTLLETEKIKALKTCDRGLDKLSFQKSHEGVEEIDMTEHILEPDSMPEVSSPEYLKNSPIGQLKTIEIEDLDEEIDPDFE